MSVSSISSIADNFESLKHILQVCTYSHSMKQGLAIYNVWWSISKESTHYNWHAQSLGTGYEAKSAHAHEITRIKNNGRAGLGYPDPGTDRIRY